MSKLMYLFEKPDGASAVIKGAMGAMLVATTMLSAANAKNLETVKTVTEADTVTAVPVSSKPGGQLWTLKSKRTGRRAYARRGLIWAFPTKTAAEAAAEKLDFIGVEWEPSLLIET